MSALFSSFSGHAAEKHKTDKVQSATGQEVTFTFFGHASFMIEANGALIYLDPVGEYADYGKLPKADAILVTHQHGDHFDKAAVQTITKESTQLYMTQAVKDELGYGHVMKNGDSFECRIHVGETNVEMKIEAVPAYNTTPGRDKFHPAGRDNGYILTINDLRIYVSGDSEPIPEMMSQKNIDVLFLSVNQPYTMTVEQAVEVVSAIRPTVFYPIHFGGVEVPTDTDELKRLLENTADIRIMPME